MNTDVTVVMPFDWLGSLIVPSVSILVSSGIAIWLARSERKAAKRDRADAALAELIVALTAVNSVDVDDIPKDEVARRLTAFVAAVNVAAAHFDRDDTVFELVVTIVLNADAAGRTALGLSAARAMSILDDWRHGRLSDESIAAELAKFPEAKRRYRA